MSVNGNPSKITGCFCQMTISLTNIGRLLCSHYQEYLKRNQEKYQLNNIREKKEKEQINKLKNQEKKTFIVEKGTLE